MSPIFHSSAHSAGTPLGGLIALLGDYLYYRKLGHRRSRAWRLARVTLRS